jgi:hypothetical protein
MTQTLPLPHFAQLRAHLDRGTPLDEVLATHGLDPGAWSAAEESWLLALSDDADRGLTQRLEAFSAAYAAEIAVLSGVPTAAPTAPSAPSLVALPAPAPAPPALGAATPPPSSVLFSPPPLLAIPSPPSRPLPSATPGSETTTLDPAMIASVVARALPFQGSSPRPAAAPPVAPLPGRDDDTVTLLNLGSPVTRAPALPFQDSEETIRIPRRVALAGAPPPRPPPGSETTLSPVLGDRPTLPFSREPAAPPPLPLETFAAIAAARSRGRPLDAILRELGLDEPTYGAADAYYQRAFSADASLAMRFSDAYRRATQSH